MAFSLSVVFSRLSGIQNITAVVHSHLACNEVLLHDMTVASHLKS